MEKEDNITMIVSIMDKTAGFFSTFFFSLNHYLYCQKNKVSFQLNTENWLFKSLHGWTDYFQPIDFQGEKDDDDVQTKKHNELLGDFSIQEYRDAIRNDVYIYNDETLRIIEEKKRQHKLFPGTYDSIFIRRGDKLMAESQYMKTERYIELLLKKNPDCHRIFLQTDDYHCFLDLQDYVQRNQLNIEILTFCDPLSKGMVMFETPLEVQLDNCVIRGDAEHKQYFEFIQNDLKQTKPVEKMNSEEIHQHTLDLLVGVDVVLHSKYCMLDKFSNVSRFITIAHDEYKNVFDIRYPDENIEMGWTMCPAYW